MLASVMSASVNLPIVARLAHDRRLTRQLTWALTSIAFLGAIGVAIQARLPVLFPGIP